MAAGKDTGHSSIFSHTISSRCAIDAWIISLVTRLGMASSEQRAKWDIVEIAGNR
jgi:hypothetical protein